MGISHHNSPSFSSSLLDAIYRSIDRGDDGEMVICGESVRKERDHANARVVCRSEEELADSRRACMTEKWMEKKYPSERTAALLQMKKPRKSDRKPESSRWNSCDFGSFYSPGSEPFPLQRPKPVRTGAFGFEKEVLESNRRGSDPNPKIIEGGGGFVKTKSRALKIYSDLKKARQPISPGGKLAGFLNSLFTVAGKPKPAGAVRSHHSPSPKSTHTSTCSSASSLSRSCLSKTPSSRVKSSCPKRSVRFSPAAATTDNDPHKSTHESNIYTKKVTTKTDDCHRSIRRNAINDDLMALIMEKNRQVEEEVAKDLLKNYQTKTHPSFQFEFSSRKSYIQNQSFDLDFQDDDDDLASCASSDLFELDNLSGIGTEKYNHELPVYETTHRANANGYIF